MNYWIKVFYGFYAEKKGARHVSKKI